MRFPISAGLSEFGSNVDFWDAEDNDEIAESIEDVRGMMRWVGRSPGADMIELTDEEAERSGSAAAGGLEMLVSLGPAILSGPIPVDSWSLEAL